MSEPRKPRRTKTTGSIRTRSDGRLEGRLTRDGKTWSVYGTSKVAVEAALRKLQAKLEKGEEPEPARLTVEQYLTRWLELSVKPAVRPTTYRSYQQLVTLYLIPGLGKKRLARLTPQDVQMFLNTLTGHQGRTLTPRTIQYTRAVLRRALNVAMRWGLVSRNVATLVEVPSGRREKVKPVTPAQARAFLRAIAGDRLEALYALYLGCGLRRGEALGLRWADVDLEAGVLTINQTLTWIGGTVHFGEPKTEESARTLHIPVTVLALLRAHHDRQETDRKKAGKLWAAGDLVFTAQTLPGQPLHPSTVTHHFYALLERAELPRQRLHDLRHACASLLIAGGASLQDVKETLGHAQVRLTSDLYTHLFDDRRREIADRMDAMLRTS